MWYVSFTTEYLYKLCNRSHSLSSLIVVKVVIQLQEGKKGWWSRSFLIYKYGETAVNKSSLINRVEQTKGKLCYFVTDWSWIRCMEISNYHHQGWNKFILKLNCSYKKHWNQCTFGRNENHW